MSFVMELKLITGRLAALCRRSFGPCGEKTLLFRPIEAPIITGEGHAVLAAWKQGLEADESLAKFLVTAANGVHQQLGDGSSEFLLLVDAAIGHADHLLRREHNVWNAVDRAHLSRAFAELKWELQREMQTPQSQLYGLRIAVPIELDDKTLQPSRRFRTTSANIVISALRGVLGEEVVKFVVDLVLTWVFTQPRSTCIGAAETLDKLLFRRVQQFLKCASDAIIFLAAPSVHASYVVPRDEFILKKSVVSSQPPELLNCCRGKTSFVCFTCPISVSAGSNHVAIATTTNEDLFSVQDAIDMFVFKLIRLLRDRFQVQLVISTEALDESVIAVCTRQGIACVQLAESEDIEALCISAGIFPLACVFDDIQRTEHVGVCANGVSRVRYQQQPCLRLRGLTKPNESSEMRRQSGHYVQDMVVPQLLVHAPTKGVYKQYYGAIIKSLRVLRSWWEPTSLDTDNRAQSEYSSTVWSCRGGGATELAVARWLQSGKSSFTCDRPRRDVVVNGMARHIFATALIEVVSILRANVSQTCRNANGEGLQRVGNQRQVLLDAFGDLQLKDQQSQLKAIHGYTLDYSRVLDTLAGPISIPELAIGDPQSYGLVHPWKRIDALLFLVLQTLEQLFRIDGITTSTRKTK